jgi:hypothetical protein
MWLAGPIAPVDAAPARAPGPLSQKIQKSSRPVLTLRAAADYIRLTNEGGAPLATRKFALEFGKSREPRERHSTGPKPKSDKAHDTAFAVSVL